MGQIKITKIIVVIACLVITSGMLYRLPTSAPSNPNRETKLSEALSILEGWNQGPTQFLDGAIVEALKTDEYINRSYTNHQDNVFLYIGYYYNAKKVGAAHDPLVCFQGQGWTIGNKETGKLVLDKEHGDSISYSMMTAQLDQKKELILYWFQSYDQTSPDTFSQKVALFLKRLQKKGEDNAFVRISVNLDDKNIDEAREIIFRFLKAFYPKFLNYIKKDNSHSL